MIRVVLDITSGFQRYCTRNADPPHFCHSNLGFRVALFLSEEDQLTTKTVEANTAVTNTAVTNTVLRGLQEFYQKTARPDGSFVLSGEYRTYYYEVKR